MRKNLVVLLLVAIFAATATATMASGNEISTSPDSGHWNFPGSFTVRNNGTETVKVFWFLDCWDHSVCSDSSGEETLAPGQSFSRGLGHICSKWQLDLRWKKSHGWDWGGIAEKENCYEEPENPEAPKYPTPELPEEEDVPTDTYPGVSCDVRGLNLVNLPDGKYTVDGHALRVWTHLGVQQGRVGPFKHGTWFDLGPISREIIPGVTMRANWITDSTGMPKYDCWFEAGTTIVTPEPEPTVIIGSIEDFMLKYGAFENLVPGAICDIYAGENFVGRFEVRSDGKLDVYSAEYAAKAADWAAMNCEVPTQAVALRLAWDNGIYSGADPGFAITFPAGHFSEEVWIEVDGHFVTNPSYQYRNGQTLVGWWEYPGIEEGSLIEICVDVAGQVYCEEVFNAGSNQTFANDGGLWQFDEDGNIRLFPGDTWNSIRNQVEPGMSHEEFRTKWLETYGSFQEGLVYDMSLWS